MLELIRSFNISVICVQLSFFIRAKELISIAHPDFRDELIRSAGEMGIWRKSDKR